MKKLSAKRRKDFKQYTTREKLSCRGGGIEIGLDFLGFENLHMSVYQNYLGGGMLGKICTDCQIRDYKQDNELAQVADQLILYYCEKMQFNQSDFDRLQSMPISAY